MSICVIGSSNVDISVFVEKLPQKGETLLGHEMTTSFGGKGANQAIASAKLGGQVSFLTCLGEDDFGDQILSNLKQLKIDTKQIKWSKKNPTGTAIITIDHQGQNTIVVNPGANGDCDIEYLKNNQEHILKSDLILLQMEIPLDAIEYAIRLAHQHDKQVILNPAPALADLNQELYSMIDYLTPNESELLIMAQQDDFEASIQQLLAWGIKNLIITMGEQGALWVTKQQRQLIKAYPVVAIDTVGAGDCFNGAFVSALSRDEPIKDAIRFANKAASIAVTRKGAQDSIPTLKELNIR